MKMAKETLNRLVSEEVKYRMIARSYSQGELARMSGVSQGTLSMNLACEHGWTLDVLERLCPFLGATPGGLISAAETRNDLWYSKQKCGRRLLEIEAEKEGLESRLQELQNEEDITRNKLEKGE
jgi:transcriptional regulator with XRE-family HTH domain